MIIITTESCMSKAEFTITNSKLQFPVSNDGLTGDRRERENHRRSIWNRHLPPPFSASTVVSFSECPWPGDHASFSKRPRSNRRFSPPRQQILRQPASPPNPQHRQVFPAAAEVVVVPLKNRIEGKGEERIRNWGTWVWVAWERTEQ